VTFIILLAVIGGLAYRITPRKAGTTPRHRGETVWRRSKVAANEPGRLGRPRRFEARHLPSSRDGEVLFRFSGG